jgi:hypothetical protein
VEALEEAVVEPALEAALEGVEVTGDLVSNMVEPVAPEEWIADPLTPPNGGLPAVLEPQADSHAAASPPVPTSEGVLFTIAAPNAQCVQLAADFNSWRADGNEMRFNGGVWTKLVPLPPGRYHYQYVVDGGWKTDPMNTAVEPTPWGGFNSVFTVEPNGNHHGNGNGSYGPG